MLINQIPTETEQQSCGLYMYQVKEPKNVVYNILDFICDYVDVWKEPWLHDLQHDKKLEIESVQNVI